MPWRGSFAMATAASWFLPTNVEGIATALTHLYRNHKTLVQASVGNARVAQYDARYQSETMAEILSNLVSVAATQVSRAWVTSRFRPVEPTRMVRRVRTCSSACGTRPRRGGWRLWTPSSGCLTSCRSSQPIAPSRSTHPKHAADTDAHPVVATIRTADAALRQRTCVAMDGPDLVL